MGTERDGRWAKNVSTTCVAPFVLALSDLRKAGIRIDVREKRTEAAYVCNFVLGDCLCKPDNTMDGTELFANRHGKPATIPGISLDLPISGAMRENDKPVEWDAPTGMEDL